MIRADVHHRLQHGDRIDRRLGRTINIDHPRNLETNAQMSRSSPANTLRRRNDQVFDDAVQVRLEDRFANNDGAAIQQIHFLTIRLSQNCAATSHRVD